MNRALLQLCGLSCVCAFLLIGCGKGSKGAAELTLETTPAMVQGGSTTTFTAFIIHNNGQFLGATWSLTSGGASCMPGCGTLNNPTNSGSSGQGDTATIQYTAPNSYANPITITAASVENPASSGSDTFSVTAVGGQPSVTTSSLPDGAVGTNYLAPPLAVTGGTPPYTWSTIAGSLPNGLALNSSSGAISGTPGTANTFDFTAQVTDSNSLTATAQLSITVTPSGTANSYFGSQSPGDIWLFEVNESATQFSATDQTTGVFYTGTFTALPNGFLATTVTTSNDPNLPAGSTGFGVESPGVGATFALGGASDKPVALVAQGPCPTLTAATTVQLINLGKSSYDAAQSESYASVTATQSGSNYNLSYDSYLLDGTLRASSGALPTGSCSNGMITIPNVPTGSGNVTVTALADNGLYIIDLGVGQGSAVGSQNFVASTNLNAELANNFLGVLFKRNSTPITTFVGFGPGSGTSISGGQFTNMTTDPFSSHGTDVTLDLSSVDANGFLQGTLTDSEGTHSPFVGMVSTNASKVFIFGITTDTSATTPYAVILLQQ
jgi:large repetitive protein